MTEIFNGRGFAQKKLEILGAKVAKIKKKGIVPKLVSIIVGENPVGLFYANLKKKTAEKIGVEVEIVTKPENGERRRENQRAEELIKSIQKFNEDKTVHGIMLQLPLPDNFSPDEVWEILNCLSPKKDVDGLGENSDYSMPTVKAVLMIMREAEKFTPLKVEPYKVLVVGHTGFEGGGVYTALTEMGYVVDGANSQTNNLKQLTQNADILISATGVPGLIKGDMVKEGVVIIDVGSPKGDFEKSVYEKASFVSPVPGGVGPVTVSCLLENLVNCASEQ